MQAAPIRQRSRLLTAGLKAQLCSLVAQSYTLESSADAIGVSLRTVQRERKLDDQFDRDVRRALGASPDPLKLMETAARTHWRAAAWLLERTRPEQYGRRPSNSASHARVSRALSSVLSAVLEKLPPEQRAEMLTHTAPAVEQALDDCFPNRPAPLAPGSSNRGPNNVPPSPERAPTVERVPTPATPSKPPVVPAPTEQLPAPTPVHAEDASNKLSALQTDASPRPTHLTNNERKRRQRQAAQLSRKIKKATRSKNRRAA